MYLFPLQESKQLYTSNALMTPILQRRDLIHDLHRQFIGTPAFRLKKSNIQTIAGRSFTLLQRKFIQDLTRIVKLLQSGDYSESESKRVSRSIFRDYYRKAYFLGLKASGVGIAAGMSSLTFRDYQDPALHQEEERWSQTAATAELRFWNKLLINTSLEKKSKYTVDQRIRFYAESLEGHYNAGRVAGSPRYSLVHWIMDKGHSTCPQCSWMAKNSPWPKELMITTPKAGMCGCLMNCRCELKIIPGSSQEYNKAKLAKPPKDQLVRKLRAVSSIKGLKL